MTTRNDITGDKIQTKPSTEAYSAGYDNIFGKKAGVSGSSNESPTDSEHSPPLVDTFRDSLERPRVTTNQPMESS